MQDNSDIELVMRNIELDNKHKIMIKYVSIGLFFLSSSVLFNNAYGQINAKEYHTAKELFEKGSDYFMNEEYVKAYDEFMKVNVNDTAYFSSRKRAIECASTENRYDTVIQLCTEILASKKVNPYRESFYTSMGDGYIDNEDYDKAIEILTIALKEFDRSSKLRYNRARAYYKSEHYNEAVEDLQIAIRFKPRYGAAHYLLGAICAEAGEYTRAALSLNMAIFVNPNNSIALRGIVLLEDLYGGRVETKNHKLKFFDDEDFAETDLILKNRLAENPKYKVKCKLTYNFIKHTHLMFEKMENIEGDNGFWNQNYVKFFKYIFDSGQYEIFAYYECLGLEDNAVQAIIKKKQTTIISFIEKSGPYLTECLNTRKVLENGKYVDNHLRHIGSYGFDEEVNWVNGKRNGDYIGYNDFGQISAKGLYTEGEMEGDWNFYEEGVLVTKAAFKDNKLEGDRTAYYGNGSRSKTIPIKDGAINGTVIAYYASNQVYSKIPFNSEGNEDGEASYFFSTGERSYSIHFKNGKRNGEYVDYFRNGQKREVILYVDGKKEGVLKMNHANGKVYIEGQYKDDKAYGHWKYFFDNGQLHQEGEFIDDKKVGIWKEFNRFGILDSETDFGEKGAKTGVYKSYDLDGNLILQLEYKGEEVNKYTTFSADGKELSTDTKKKRELEFIGYHSNGVKSVEGKYYKGNEVGIWKFFNLQGVLIKELNYNDEGLLDGKSNWYFDNGEIEIVKNFLKGYLDGYFVEYYKNGKIYTNGWYLEGDKVGLWESYERNGQLLDQTYYLEGDIHGDVSFYDGKGKLREMSTYFYGSYMSTTTFDTLGGVSGYIELIDGAANAEYVGVGGKISTKKTYKGGNSHGDFIGFYADGTTRQSGSYIGGRKEGIWKWYNRKGILTAEGEYVSGVQDGIWKWYYDNGNLSSEKTFIDGKVEGKYVKYYENGKIRNEKNYRDDELHGTSTYYALTGEIKYLRYFEDGFMLGYSYLGADGKPVKMISFNNSDGVIETFYQNGKPSYYSEYKGGFSHGKTIHYHTNGKIQSERLYDKDLLDGVYKEYYASGKLKEESNYSQGARHGSYTTYFENGKTEFVENYTFDDLFGDAAYYDASGKLIEKAYYYSGRKIK